MNVPHLFRVSGTSEGPLLVFAQGDVAIQVNNDPSLLTTASIRRFRQSLVVVILAHIA